MENAVFGLRLNHSKTNWMGSLGVREGELMVGGKLVERLKALVYLGSELDWKGGCGGEVRRRVAAAAAAFERLKAL